MNIGIPKERKVHEYRVSLTPQAVSVLTQSGNKVFVEKEAGTGSGIQDSQYIDVGAEILETEEEVFKKSELIVKVKEPVKEEFHFIKENHTVFCYLHLAANRAALEALKESGTKAIAFETVELSDGSLPLLSPMSRIAGRLSIQAGIHFLERQNGGKGVLLSGAPGVGAGKVAIIGGGTVGYNAALSALGLGAEVTVIDIKPEKLEFFHDKFGGRVKTLPSYPEIIEQELRQCDLAVGAVLVTGVAAPKVITAHMVHRMETGSVLVDVAIDQGGCSETSRPTNLDSPVFDVEGVTHYCVTNIPSLVSRTATFALSNSILPFVRQIADGKIEENSALRRAVNVDQGEILFEFGIDKE